MSRLTSCMFFLGLVCEISSDPRVSWPGNITKAFCPCPNVRQLQQELDNLQEEFVDLQQDQDGLQQEHNDLKSEFIDLQQDQDDLQKELTDLKTLLNAVYSEAAKNTSCEDISKRGETNDGVYTIYPFPDGSKSLDVFCDLNTDKPGWIVFQKRTDGSIDFYRYWDDYVNGFGDKINEYWLGLENIHQLLSEGDFELRVDMSDFEGQSKYAKYSSFRVEEGSGYVMYVSGYSGNAGDSMATHNGMKFSTRDKNQDNHSVDDCASLYKGAWWYNKCFTANPNGLYLAGPHSSVGDGIEWYHWHGSYYSLKSIEFKVRRKLY